MKKALFITYNSIKSSLSGGSQCSLRNLGMVSAFYDTTVYQVENSKIQKLVSSFFGYFSPVTFTDTRKILKLIEENDYEIVFFDASLFGNTIKKIRKKTNIKVISFFHNVEYDYVTVRFGRRLIKLIYLFLAYLNEKKTLINSDCTIVLNLRDHKRLQSIYDKSSDFVIPITFDDLLTISKEPRLVENDFLLFVGSLNRANLEAIKWFIEEVFVKINKFDLVIVGKDFETLREELRSERVNVVGTVDDIGVYYNQSSAVVSPLLSGAGMKVKVAEALMYGKTIFGTRETFEGYELVENSTILCQTADEFIKKINLFANSLNSKELFNSESRNLFLNKYSHSIAHRTFEEIIEKLK